MVIEYLKFRVTPELREQFIQKDDEIWTAFLATHEGFLGKEVWISPDDLAEVVALIRWVSMEAWQAIPSDKLEEVEAQFAEAMGGGYEMVAAARYQVRKFVQ